MSYTNQILIVSATRYDCKNTKLYNSYKNLLQSEDVMGTEINMQFINNNTKGLPEVYNDYLNDSKYEKYKWIIFSHSDLYIDDLCLADKLDAVRSRFDIVGLAGATECKIEHPALWHIMGGGFGGGNLRGYVMHPSGQDTISATGFGPTPAQVVVLDGLFIAVNVTETNKKGWKFDSRFRFHHYDVASTLQAHKLGLRLGVAPINAIHDSPGLLSLEDPEWSKSNKKFLEEYK